MKKTYSTFLMDLYGEKKYSQHIHVGDELWILEGILWIKIKVSYIRSGVLFYNIVGSDKQEQWLPVESYKIAKSIVARLDPYKDLPYSSRLYNCRFDDTRTEVVNFDNSPEV